MVMHDLLSIASEDDDVASMVPPLNSMSPSDLMALGDDFLLVSVVPPPGKLPPPPGKPPPPGP